MSKTANSIREGMERGNLMNVHKYKYKANNYETGETTQIMQHMHEVVHVQYQ